MDEHELSSSEKAALEAMRRDLKPGPQLEGRVVRALRRRGVLGARSPRSVDVTPARVVAAAAACVILVTLGFAVGRWASPEDGDAAPSEPRPTEAMAIAESLQQAGTAYVSAIDDLAAAPGGTDSEHLRQGREVALVALCTAASEAGRVVPKRLLATQLLRALDVDTASPDHRSPRQRIVRF